VLAVPSSQRWASDIGMSIRFSGTNRADVSAAAAYLYLASDP
jgi:hypothetical protein